MTTRINSRRTRLMGIVNVTPDSFSDGGEYNKPGQAVKHALGLLESGADIIDIGGESTRPGADLIPDRDEIGRVVPVIAGLKAAAADCIVSIDTRKYAVAEAALRAGANMVNDVSGLQYSPRLAELVAEHRAKLVLMHMRGTPDDMQSPEHLVYDDVVAETLAFLMTAADKAVAAGVSREDIIIDPGIGFSKTTEQNFELLGRIDEFVASGFSVLVGPSRKSFIGKTLGLDNPGDRVFGTAGAVAYLAQAGVDIVRVHDVPEMRQMLDIFERCIEVANKFDRRK